MITLKQFAHVTDFKITDAEPYTFDGKYIIMLSYWNQDHDGFSMDIYFDPIEQTPEFQTKAVHLHDYKNQRAYRIQQPNFDEDNQAWDDVKYIDLETCEDMLDKMMALMNGEEYDDRVAIPLDLPDDVLLILMKDAHEKDITFNQYLTEIISEKLKQYV
jgi:hypothetical protein